jgi:hypothetical protein
MPGIKRGGSAAAHAIAPVKGDGESIITAVEIADEDIELPSTEGYVSTRKHRTKTPDGVVDEPEWYWTKKGLSAWLSVCPKVAVRVDIDREIGETNPQTARPLSVYYDGFRIDVPKGRTVMVAKPIADVIANMQTEFRTAQSRGIDLYLINPDDPTDHGYEIPALAAVSG